MQISSINQCEIVAKKHYRGGDFINLGNILLFGLVIGIEMGQMEDNFPQGFLGSQLYID